MYTVIDIAIFLVFAALASLAGWYGCSLWTWARNRRSNP